MIKKVVPVALVVVAFLGGYFLSHFTKPDPPEIDLTKYELQNEIQRLQYESKIKDLEKESLQRLHFLESADSVELDSIWHVYDL